MPPRKRRRTPGVVNKAKDLGLDRDMARAMGWLGQGFRPPPGPPWPWDELAGPDELLYARAVNRLTVGGVPVLAAQVICWSDGDWAKTCRMIADAEAVQVYPDRQHIRLVPKPVYFAQPPPGKALPS
jgi:hypothetical protein